MSLLEQQLLTMRANAQAIVATAEAVLSALRPPPGSTGPCQHPPETRTPVARMGAPEAWRCACGAEGSD